MGKIKKIGILTSGGDCAGLNAVIRAVVNCATLKGWQVYGIRFGTDGLTSRPLQYQILTPENFSDTPWPRLSGSYLGSLNSGVKLESVKNLSKNFGDGARELGLDALIVVGGDGSMNIVSNYCHLAGIKMIGIPKTIDNDTPITDSSVGFATACQVCTEALDSLILTARSHNRAIILEVMGRDAGHLALHSAIAGMADVCLVPEIPYKIDSIIKKLREVKKTGRNYALIVAAEGIKREDGQHVSSTKNKIGESVYGGVGQYLSDEINHRCKDFQTRVTTLGHTQRSGNPSSTDRVLAARFGARAIELLDKGHTNRMVVLKNNTIGDYDIDEVVKVGTKKLDLNSDYIKAARATGMYIGEEIPTKKA